MAFRTLFFFSLILTTLGTSACSSVFKREAPPAVRATVLSVSASFLGNVTTRNFRRLNSLVLWSNYLERGKDGMKKSEFVHQVDSLQGRWPAEQHPLLGLGVEEISIEDDLALVRLKKSTNPDAEDIRIDLFWNGTAWMVINDSLFGDGMQIERWTQVRARPAKE